MRRLLILLIGLLIGITPSTAQFIVTSSVPADGAVNVPPSTTVSFTFSEPIDTTVRFTDLGLPISANPNDSIEISAVSYSTDLRTVTFNVVHTGDSDFTWAILGARSNTGNQLDRPFALNYTTAPSHGPYSVGGTVTVEGGSTTNVIVGLADGPVIGERDAIVRVATVVSDPSGVYSYSYVRDGVYWPLAVKDADGNGEFDPMRGDPVGFYDPNNDGQPDSIVISGSNRSGIDMTLRAIFVPVMARQYLDTARAIALGYASDQKLRGIFTESIELDGRSPGWLYYFYSPSGRFPTRVIVAPRFIQVDTTSDGEPQLPLNMRPIPLEFIDSDVPMSIAETNGGSAFRAAHNVVRRSLSGGNFKWVYPQDTTRIFWIVEYESIDPGGTREFFRAFIDMITGTLLPGGSSGVNDPRMPICAMTPRELVQPNPCTSTTTIRYSLAVRCHVRLSIVDELGREVSCLLDSPMNPGDHTEMFDARTLHNGIYFYRLMIGNECRSGKLVVWR